MYIYSIPTKSLKTRVVIHTLASVGLLNYSCGGPKKGEFSFAFSKKNDGLFLQQRRSIVILHQITQWAKAIISTQINSNHHKFIVMPCIVVRLNIRECCSTIKMYQSLLKLIKMNQKLLEPVK